MATPRDEHTKKNEDTPRVTVLGGHDPGRTAQYKCTRTHLGVKFTGLTKPHAGATAFDRAETYSGLEYQYTPDGHLEAAIESRGSASVTVERYRITAKDARGQVTGMSKGGIDVSRTYSADTGRLQSIYSQNQLAVTIQDFAFDWDVLGNFTDKVDSHRGLNEGYDCDALNRLTSVSGSSSLSLTYDGLGYFFSS